MDQGRRDQAGADNENYAAVEQQHLEERARLDKATGLPDSPDEVRVCF